MRAVVSSAAFRLTAGGLLGLIALEGLAIVLLTGGVLEYTLDDPYIHLALAENIARGHYGVNLVEPSSPSSSPLWPLLLAPLAPFEVGRYVPLLLSVAASVATAGAFVALLLGVLREGTPHRHGLAGGLALLLALATNQVALPFTGMEHSVQVACAALVALGLAAEAQEGRVRGWLLAALLVGPLIRYENLAVTVPALGYLAVRGHRAAALAVGAGVALGLGAFSAFLVHLSLPLLPASVLLKSSVVEGGGGLASVLANVWENARAIQFIPFLEAGLLLAVAAVRPGRVARADRWLAAAGVGTVGLHVLVGRFGWYGRYEVYAWAFVLLLVLALYRALLRRLTRRLPPLLTLALAAAVLCVVAFFYVEKALSTPLAARNIHDQHRQMHRFVAEVYRRPVAVNDLGWVAFRNDHYVLDLWGLASVDAQVQRREGDAAWVDRAAARYGVDVAMVYDAWLGDAFRDRWVRLGELQLDGPLITPASPTVAFYARDASAAAAARPALERFARTLPPHARFVFEP